PVRNARSSIGSVETDAMAARSDVTDSADRPTASTYTGTSMPLAMRETSDELSLLLLSRPSEMTTTARRETASPASRCAVAATASRNDVDPNGTTVSSAASKGVKSTDNGETSCNRLSNVKSPAESRPGWS